MWLNECPKCPVFAPQGHFHTHFMSKLPEWSRTGAWPSSPSFVFRLLPPLSSPAVVFVLVVQCDSAALGSLASKSVTSPRRYTHAGRLLTQHKGAGLSCHSFLPGFSHQIHRRSHSDDPERQSETHRDEPSVKLCTTLWNSFSRCSSALHHFHPPASSSFGGNVSGILSETLPLSVCVVCHHGSRVLMRSLDSQRGKISVFPFLRFKDTSLTLPHAGLFSSFIVRTEHQHNLGPRREHQTTRLATSAPASGPEENIRTKQSTVSLLYSGHIWLSPSLFCHVARSVISAV